MAGLPVEAVVERLQGRHDEHDPAVRGRDLAQKGKRPLLRAHMLEHVEEDDRVRGKGRGFRPGRFRILEVQAEGFQRARRGGDPERLQVPGVEVAAEHAAALRQHPAGILAKADADFHDATAQPRLHEGPEVPVIPSGRGHG